MSSTHNGVPVVIDNFSFPLAINLTILDPDGSSCRFQFAIHSSFTNLCLVKALIDHSYNRDLLPLPIVVRSNIQEHQIAGKLFVISTSGMPKVIYCRWLLPRVSKWKHGKWNQQQHIGLL